MWSLKDFAKVRTLLKTASLLFFISPKLSVIHQYFRVQYRNHFLQKKNKTYAGLFSQLRYESNQYEFPFFRFKDFRGINPGFSPKFFIVIGLSSRGSTSKTHEKCWSRIKILDKNRKIDQASKFLSKSKFVSKNQYWFDLS